MTFYFGVPGSEFFSPHSIWRCEDCLVEEKEEVRSLGCCSPFSAIKEKEETTQEKIEKIDNQISVLEERIKDLKQQRESLK